MAGGGGAGGEEKLWENCVVKSGEGVSVGGDFSIVVPLYYI